MHSYLNKISKGQHSQNLGTQGKWSLGFLCYFYSVIALSGKKKKDYILDNFTVQSNEHLYSCQKTPSVYSAWVHKKVIYCRSVIQLSRGVRRTKKKYIEILFLTDTYKNTHTNISYGLCFFYYHHVYISLRERACIHFTEINFVIGFIRTNKNLKQ